MNVFFRQTPEGYEWLETSDDALKSEYHTGSLDDFAKFYADNAGRNNWVLVTSALDVIHKYFSFTAKEKKHIEKAVPFMLEEDVITDIEDLHFITHKTSESQLAVVAVEKSVISRWVKKLQSKGVVPSHCISPYNLVPESDSDWLLLYQSGEYLIKATDKLLSIDQSGLSVCLQCLTDNFADLPKTIDVVIFSDKDKTEALQGIPEGLHHLINWREMEYGKLLQSEFPQAKKWNMLTGSYALSNNWLELLKPWRWVIVGFCLVYMTDLGITAFQSSRYQHQVKAVKVQTDALFRQVVPRGVIVDHQRQLSKLLKNKDVKSNTQFSNLIAAIVPSLTELPTEINSINYDSNNAELRLDLVVDNFSMLEMMMNKLKQQGLTTEIQNSSQQDDKLRVRLKIGG